MMKDGKPRFRPSNLCSTRGARRGSLNATLKSNHAKYPRPPAKRKKAPA
jgi:hypothetical protein